MRAASEQWPYRKSLLYGTCYELGWTCRQKPSLRWSCASLDGSCDLTVAIAIANYVCVTCNFATPNGDKRSKAVNLALTDRPIGKKNFPGVNELMSRLNIITGTYARAQLGNTDDAGSMIFTRSDARTLQRAGRVPHRDAITGEEGDTQSGGSYVQGEKERKEVETTAQTQRRHVPQGRKKPGTEQWGLDNDDDDQLCELGGGRSPHVLVLRMA
ncbi:hypothetical protein BJV74DRAFT_914903 [Russula compacta]|nr:hypothetical protein BJV74DRAFT_914903 [Russula compacta]